MRDEEIGILINNKSYISVVRAADLTGYHGDYIGRLCREKKIDGIKIGNNWLVAQEDILNLSSKNGSKKKFIYQRLGEGGNVALATSKISVINNTSDEWDKALFNDSPVERPFVNKKFNVVSPTFTTALIFILLAGFLFYRHPESIYANFKDFKNFSSQISNQVYSLKTSLQTSAILTAASL